MTSVSSEDNTTCRHAIPLPFKMIGMQLPQNIIDLVGNLFDEGMDDETICHAVLKEWRKRMENPAGKRLETTTRRGIHSIFRHIWKIIL